MAAFPWVARKSGRVEGIELAINGFIGAISDVGYCKNNPSFFLETDYIGEAVNNELVIEYVHLQGLR